MAREAQLAGLELLLVISMWTPHVYAFHSRESLTGTDQDKSIVRIVGMSELVVWHAMNFIDTCHNAYLFRRIGGLRAFNNLEGELEKHWKVLG